MFCVWMPVRGCVSSLNRVHGIGLPSVTGVRLSPFADAWSQCVSIPSPLSKVIGHVNGAVSALTDGYQRVDYSGSLRSDVILSSRAPLASAFPTVAVSELPPFAVGVKPRADQLRDALFVPVGRTIRTVVLRGGKGCGKSTAITAYITRHTPGGTGSGYPGGVIWVVGDSIESIAESICEEMWRFEDLTDKSAKAVWVWFRRWLSKPGRRWLLIVSITAPCDVGAAVVLKALMKWFGRRAASSGHVLIETQATMPAVSSVCAPSVHVVELRALPKVSAIDIMHRCFQALSAAQAKCAWASCSKDNTPRAVGAAIQSLLPKLAVPPGSDKYVPLVLVRATGALYTYGATFLEACDGLVGERIVAYDERKRVCGPFLPIVNKDERDAMLGSHRSAGPRGGDEAHGGGGDEGDDAKRGGDEATGGGDVGPGQGSGGGRGEDATGGDGGESEGESPASTAPGGVEGAIHTCAGTGGTVVSDGLADPVLLPAARDHGGNFQHWNPVGMRIVALHGQDPSHNAEAANRYVSATVNHYPGGVFMLRGESSSTLRDSINDVASRLTLPAATLVGGRDIDACHMFFRWVAQMQARCLLVVDGVSFTIHTTTMATLGRDSQPLPWLLSRLRNTSNLHLLFTTTAPFFDACQIAPMVAGVAVDSARGTNNAPVEQLMQLFGVPSAVRTVPTTTNVGRVPSDTAGAQASLPCAGDMHFNRPRHTVGHEVYPRRAQDINHASRSAPASTAAPASLMAAPDSPETRDTAEQSVVDRVGRASTTKQGERVVDPLPDETRPAALAAEPATATTRDVPERHTPWWW